MSLSSLFSIASCNVIALNLCCLIFDIISRRSINFKSNQKRSKEMLPNMIINDKFTKKQ